MLDKGVSERELTDDEKPWLIMQRNRRVCLSAIFFFPQIFLLPVLLTLLAKKVSPILILLLVPIPMILNSAICSQINVL